MFTGHVQHTKSSCRPWKHSAKQGQVPAFAKRASQWDLECLGGKTAAGQGLRCPLTARTPRILARPSVSVLWRQTRKGEGRRGGGGESCLGCGGGSVPAGRAVRTEVRTRKATSHVALWEGKVPVRANDKSKFEVGEELSRRKVRVPGRRLEREAEASAGRLGGGGKAVVFLRAGTSEETWGRRVTGCAAPGRRAAQQVCGVDPGQQSGGRERGWEPPASSPDTCQHPGAAPLPAKSPHRAPHSVKHSFLVCLRRYTRH